MIVLVGSNCHLQLLYQLQENGASIYEVKGPLYRDEIIYYHNLQAN